MGMGRGPWSCAVQRDLCMSTETHRRPARTRVVLARGHPRPPSPPPPSGDPGVLRGAFMAPRSFGEKPPVTVATMSSDLGEAAQIPIARTRRSAHLSESCAGGSCRQRAKHSTFQFSLEGAFLWAIIVACADRASTRSLTHDQQWRIRHLRRNRLRRLGQQEPSRSCNT